MDHIPLFVSVKFKIARNVLVKYIYLVRMRCLQFRVYLLPGPCEIKHFIVMLNEFNDTES